MGKKNEHLSKEREEGAETDTKQAPRRRSHRKRGVRAQHSGSDERQAERKRNDSSWQKRVNEELERQKPVHRGSSRREAVDAKRKGDQQAGKQAGIREGRDDGGQERERVGDDRGRQQGRGSQSGQRDFAARTGDVFRGRGRYIPAPSPRSTAAQFRPEGERKRKYEPGIGGSSVLNTFKRGTQLNPKRQVTQ